MIEYDYVVVGGGAAGVAAAARLAEEAGDATVCLLEAGPTDDGNRRVQTIGGWTSVSGSYLDWNYFIEPQERGNDLIRLQAGRVLGGSTAISTGVAFRTPEADLQAWQDAGAAGWGPRASRAALDRVLEGVGVEAPHDPTEAAAAFVDAAQEAGYPLVEFTIDIETGVGWFWRTARGDARKTCAAAYLRPRPSGLTVLTRTLARRIRLSGDRAVGVDTLRGRIGARREVIVSCGAYETPRLLLQSGIGPERLLSELGVDTSFDLPEVGEGLVDRPAAVVIWETNEPGSQTAAALWEAGLFTPDLQLHFSSKAYDELTAKRGYPTSPNSICVSPRVARPQSRGSVRVRSLDPRDPLVVDPRYLTDSDGYDERVLVEGVEIARRLARQPELRKLIDRELAPGLGVTGSRAVGEYIRRTGFSSHQASGTCRMGAADDDEAVVDPQLRVRGIERLRIADASVFPLPVGVDPALTCMVVGDRCAGFAVADAG